MSGLGWLPAVYDQNPSECMSSVLKREKEASGKKEVSIPEFARLLKRVIKRQRSEEELVLIGVGDELHLDPDYKGYGMEEIVFYRKSQDQRNTFLKMFHHATINITKELPVDLQDTFAEANAVCLWKTLISSKFHSQSWLECTTTPRQFYNRHRKV